MMSIGCWQNKVGAQTARILLVLVAAAVLSAFHSLGAATFNIANGDVAGLISAINTANSNNQNDDINLAPSGTYSLTSVNNTTQGSNGLPAILTDNGHQLNIYGNGATISRISSPLNFRIFFIASGYLALNQLVISNGRTNDTNGPWVGGAILSFAALSLSGCVLSDNYAHLDGGAIQHDGSSLAVDSCTFSRNTAIGRGGGIDCVHGNLTVTDSTFISNQADMDDQTQEAGGAIYISSTNASLSYNTFDQDASSTNRPGAAVVLAGDASITNCTFAANRGSAIVYIVGGITATITSCTLARNLGGPDIFNNGGNLTIRNTIIGPLYNTSGGTVTSQGYNISNYSNPLLNGPGDQTNTDPQLDDLGLQDNGGPTKTIALTFGSPAIDKGKSFGLTIDQRGVARPYDNPSVPNASGGDGSDIGAYEAPQDPVQGGTNFVVTTSDDHNDGVCSGTDCTLREALQKTSALAGPGTITFAGNVIGTITLQLGLGALSVSHDTTISGPGARILAISGNENHRVFIANAGTSTISGLTIRDGWAAGGVAGASNPGGGIYNQASLTLNDCAFTNNVALGVAAGASSGNDGGSGQGGGIFNAGTLTLNRCTFYRGTSGNVAGGGSGAYNPGQFSSGGAGGVGQGGAVFNAVSATLFANNCTFNGNSAAGGSGGNGTQFGGNGASGCGGAVCNQGTMTVTACTLSGNAGGSGAGGHGPISNGFTPSSSGGLTTLGGSSTVMNTISAGNTGSFGGGNDVDGTFASNGYNLLGTADHSTGFTGTGDQTGTDVAQINARLGPLQNNGGSTDTMALLANSPALDQGKSFALTTDQRGSPRPFDNPGIANASGGDGSDIGAFEVAGIAPSSAVSRKMHGATMFDIGLPLTGTAGVECRTGGVNGAHQVIATFPAPVSLTNASVTTGTGSVSGFSVSGSQVTVNLTGVSNAQKIMITLFGVTDGTNTMDVSVPMGVLLGDTTGNGTVNASDVSQTKLKSGQVVDATNFRNDVTVSNSINSSDVSTVKLKSGTALPP